MLADPVPPSPHAPTPREVARAERDLRWYWRESEGELSPPSNYAWMVRCLEGGATTNDLLVDWEIPESRRLQAARRQRAVQRRLSRLTPTDCHVLHAALGPWSGPMLTCFGSVTPLAPHLPTTKALWDDLGRPDESVEIWTVRLAYAAGKGRKAATLRATQIRREAERIYAEALQRYLEAGVVHAI